MKHLCINIVALLLSVAIATSAVANAGLDSTVYCDANGNSQIDVGVDLPLNGVGIDVSGDQGFAGSATTGMFSIDGYYTLSLSLTFPETYSVSIDESTIPGGAAVVQPTTGVYNITANAIGDRFTRNFLVDQSACVDEPEGACWLTAGGVKFSSITGGSVAEHGPRHNLGGNVFPSCDPAPGNGGQWNHVDHSNKLHFQGFDIHTVACGNVSGIEEGSESPVTPFNYIEFAGTGRLQGIKGNKLGSVPVSFFARVEDRNEPGNDNAADGEDVDRYYIHVYSDDGDPFGTTLMLVDEDGDAMSIDPVTITGGNLRLHASSCDN
jgi:hypothetical protein